jgi:membrane fusion protein, heavy metal efflux system
MNKRPLYIAATIVLVGLAGYWLYRELIPGAETTPASQPAPQAAKSQELRFPAGAPQLSYLKIESVAAYPEPLLDPLNGRIAYDENHTTRLSSPITGRVTRIAAQPGDRVAAGQVLMEIDAPDYAQALSDVNKATADLRLKQSAYNRSKELVEGEVLARKELETAEADFKQSEAERNRAAARLRNLTQGRMTANGRFVLRATLAGIVAERKVNPGAEVRPDAPDPLFTITDPAHLWVIVDLPERLLAAVHQGQPVIVEVDAYPNERFPAEVASIGAVVDPATRRVQVRCVLDNPRALLKPEMYARVTPIAEGHSPLPRIPNSALITEGLYSYLFVETSPGVFLKRRVTLGLQGHNYSYVKEGLQDGERIVTNGALLLNSELAGQ